MKPGGNWYTLCSSLCAVSSKNPADLSRLTALATAVEEDIGGFDGVLWSRDDVMVATTATGAAKSATSSHGITSVLGM